MTRKRRAWPFAVSGAVAALKGNGNGEQQREMTRRLLMDPLRETITAAAEKTGRKDTPEPDGRGIG